MELKDYREMPDAGLYEKIERRLVMRRRVRGTVWTAVAVVMVAVVTIAVWPHRHDVATEAEADSGVAQLRHNEYDAAHRIAEAVTASSQDEDPQTSRDADRETRVPHPAATVHEESTAAPTAMSTVSPIAHATQEPAMSHSSQRPVAVSQPMPKSLSGEGENASLQSKAEMDDVVVVTASFDADPVKSPSAPSDNGSMFWAPNVMAPDGEVDDNRTFHFVFSDATGVSDFRVQIYNRGGRRLYTSTDPLFRWDGRHHGEMLPQGTYVWVVQYRDAEGHKHQEKGTVTLIR